MKYNSKILIVVGIFLISIFIVRCKNEDKNSNLKVTSIYKLDETDYIIGIINNINYSPNGKKFILSANGNKSVAIYDDKTKNIEIIFELPEYITDTIADQYSKREAKFYKQFKYHSFEYLKRTLNQNIPSATYKNEIVFANFINDSIICCLANIKILRFPLDADLITYRKLNFRMIPTFIYINLINNNYEIHSINDNPQDNLNLISFIQGEIFCTDNIEKTNYLISKSSYLNINKEDPDTCSVISKVDFKGKFMNYIKYLPSDYLLSKLKYDIMYHPYFIFQNKIGLISVFPYVDSLFILNNGKERKFKIQNTDNRIMFDSIRILRERNEDIEKQKPVILRNQNFININLNITNNNLIFLYSRVKKIVNDSSKLIPNIKFYNLEGKLIKDLDVNEINENGKIKYVHCRKDINKIMIFRKNEKNWMVEEYEY